MIAAALGWTVDAIADQVRPVLRDGRVEGLRQEARALVDGEERIRLDLTMAVDLEDPVDRVRVEGEPSFVAEIPGGLHGDIATCALVANALPLVRAAPPGLRTVLELPPLRFSG
jgi:4-hydroxy-tetrahydrodipicolinate reductase